jgi:hypothetical protein
MACGDISRLPDGVIGVAGDLFNEDCPATWPIGAVDYLVYCAAATDHDEAGYPGLCPGLATCAGLAGRLWAGS